MGRDADYYFAAWRTFAAGRCAFLKFQNAAIGAIACPTYNGLKIPTYRLGIGSVMRADKNKQNALPAAANGWD